MNLFICFICGLGIIKYVGNYSKPVVLGLGPLGYVIHPS